MHLKSPQIGLKGLKEGNRAKKAWLFENESNTGQNIVDAEAYNNQDEKNDDNSVNPKPSYSSCLYA